MKVLVVGAGLSGAVIARELAEAGHYVHVIDKRDHVAGNAFDSTNRFGIRVHKYGPHIMHTSNGDVIEWISRFADWVPYFHKVKAMLSNGALVSFPVNKTTADIVGRENVIDIFFRPYTRKMWGVDLEELNPDIIARVPIRDDNEEKYFPNDIFQGLPLNGYTSFILEILRHSSIKTSLNLPFRHDMPILYDHVFNSMPIDEYFNFDRGRLPYRSIRFSEFTLPIKRIFPVSVVNFTDDGPFTRVTEWKGFPGHGSSDLYTTLTLEEPCRDDENNFEKFYPIRDVKGDNKNIYNCYKIRVPKNMTFIGRCGLYAYLDMHQAINSALSVTRKLRAAVNRGSKVYH